MGARVQGRLVADADEGMPGDFEFAVDGAGNKVMLIYQCPCGCKMVGALRIRGPHTEERPSWEWDGNERAPTLSPSVHHLINKQTHWHGHLKAGVWESC